MPSTINLSVESRENRVARYDFQFHGCRADGWGCSVAHAAWGPWVKTLASTRPGGAVYPLGKTHLLELARTSAAAWNEGEKAVDTVQPVAAALRTVGQSWDSGRGRQFDRLFTTELSNVVAENQPEFEAKPTGPARLSHWPESHH